MVFQIGHKFVYAVQLALLLQSISVGAQGRAFNLLS